MNVIKPDKISLTTHHLHMCFTETNAVLSSGTGFIYRRKNEYLLITSWHNVSGRHPEKKQCLSEKLAVPDMISAMFRDKSSQLTVIGEI